MSPEDKKRISDAYDARIATAKREGFEHFMSNPATKMLVSLVPETPSHPDLLRTLLEAAFGAGLNAGQGATLIGMLQAATSALRDEKGGGG